MKIPIKTEIQRASLHRKILFTKKQTIREQGAFRPKTGMKFKDDVTGWLIKWK